MRRLLALLLLAVVLTLALPAVASAADFYVEAPPTGNDVTGDGSAANPFATIQHGLDVAGITPGAPHAVHVGAGTFTGNLYMLDGVSLYGAGPGVTIVSGTGSGPVVTFSDLGGGETIEGFEITGGWANYDFGGGIGCANSSPTITGNTITGNYGYYGGGIACLGASPTIANNTIVDNESEFGGGIGVFDGSSPTIIGNRIAANNGDTGGGITALGSTPVISGNVITGNISGSGGGINATESTSLVTNNLVAGNRAYYGGGGVSCNLSTTTLVNNTIVENNLDGFNQGTGGLELMESSVTMVNCMIWGNAGPSIDVRSGLPPVITYSCIEGGWAGAGNIDLDPRFTSTSPPYSLTLSSPCIDTGTATGAPSTDLTGRARPQGAGFDMGAYEYPAYAVTFDSAGGSAVASQDVYEGGTATTPAAPTRVGHTFGGWYTDTACTNAWDFATPISAPTTLHAKWTPLPITGMDATYTMHTGDSLTIDAKPDGGTWNWDAAFFSATFNSPATFTALRTGSSVVTYTANGVTASATIAVVARPVPAVTSARTLPATGADVAPTVLAALLAACAGVALRISPRRV